MIHKAPSPLPIPVPKLLTTRGEEKNDGVAKPQSNLFYLLSKLTWPRAQISSFVENLFAYNTQYDKFRLNLRDFLISLKEFAGDNAELYIVEKEQQERDAKAADLERRAKVGGLLKPSELEEDEL